MALCATISDFTLDCRDNVGGIEEVYVAAASGSISFGTPPANGAVNLTAITLDGTALTGLTDLATFALVKQTGTLTETGTFSEENGTAFYTSVASCVFNKITGAKLEQVYGLGITTLLCVIVKDNNGRYFMIGNDRGALVSNSTAEAGTAFGDRNGITIEFTGIDQNPMYEVTVA
jgi:hypothetical protein